MEQRKDLKIQPVQVASTDPAFISGLMPSGPDAPEEPGGDAAEGTSPAAEGLGEDGTGQEVDASADDTAEAEAMRPDDASEAEAEAESDEAEGSADTKDAGADGPVFEAVDRRGSVVVDARGVRFTLDDQAAEWTWEEIGAVEYATSRFGRRLTVTVHTPDRRWYPGEVQAGNKATLNEWTARLDEVLDAYFEDEDEEAPSDEDASAGTEASDGTETPDESADTTESAQAETEAEAEAEAETEAKAETGAESEAKAEAETDAKPEPEAEPKAKAKAKAKSTAKD